MALGVETLFVVVATVVAQRVALRVEGRLDGQTTSSSTLSGRRDFVARLDMVWFVPVDTFALTR